MRKTIQRRLTASCLLIVAVPAPAEALQQPQALVPGRPDLALVVPADQRRVSMPDCQRVADAGDDAIVAIARDLQPFVAEIVYAVIDGLETRQSVAVTVRQFASGRQDLGLRNEEGGSVLQQAAAAMEPVTLQRASQAGEPIAVIENSCDQTQKLAEVRAGSPLRATST